MQLDMPGYLYFTLSNQKHTNPSQPQDLPYPWVVPQHVIKISQILLLPEILQAQHHNIIGTLLQYD